MVPKLVKCRQLSLRLAFFPDPFWLLSLHLFFFNNSITIIRTFEIIGSRRGRSIGLLTNSAKESVDS